MWCCDVTVNSQDLESAFWIKHTAGLYVCSFASRCHINIWAVALIETHPLCVFKASISFRRSWLPNVYSREFLWAASEHPRFSLSLSLSEWTAITMKREQSWSCCSAFYSKTFIFISMINVRVAWTVLWWYRFNHFFMLFSFSQPDRWPVSAWRCSLEFFDHSLCSTSWELVVTAESGCEPAGDVTCVVSERWLQVCGFGEGTLSLASLKG